MFKFNLVNIMLLTLIVVFSKPVFSDSNNDTNSQTNQTGSNTQITGGYTSTTTNNNDGQTNTTTSTTTNNSTTNGSDIPVNSANAPSYSAMSQDVCSMGVSGSLSTLGVGISGGKHFRDLNCERIKLSKVLYDYGMKVAAVSILCQDERVFFAMEMAGTPCPFEGKIGAEAKAQWNKYDKLRPDYEMYVDKLKVIERKEKELAKKDAKDKSLKYSLTEQTAIANEIRKENKKLDDYATKLEKKIEKLEKKNKKDK